MPGIGYVPCSLAVRLLKCQLAPLKICQSTSRLVRDLMSSMHHVDTKDGSFMCQVTDGLLCEMIDRSRSRGMMFNSYEAMQ